MHTFHIIPIINLPQFQNVNYNFLVQKLEYTNKVCENAMKQLVFCIVKDEPLTWNGMSAMVLAR